jgi:hypothetical protein
MTNSTTALLAGESIWSDEGANTAPTSSSAFDPRGYLARKHWTNGVLPADHQSESAHPVPEVDVSSERPTVVSTTLARGATRGQTTSQLLAEWHGQVTEVLSSTFSAQLRGRHGEGVIGKEEVAVIPIGELREDDISLLEPGAFFSLSVSYEISLRGRRKFTEVVFRRLPAYRREELELAQSRGRELARALHLE